MNATNNIALITGSSQGIGAATAIALAQQGYDICVHYHSNKSAADRVKQTIEALGQKAICLQADLRVESDITALFNSIDNKLGKLSLLVNNAGIVKPQSCLIDMNAERINDLLQTNVTSYFICCREAIKRMSTQHKGNGGNIINVSSVASKYGAAFEYIDYAASKGAIDALTKGLSIELADQNIRVNGVRPGFIATKIHADGGEPNRLQRLAPVIPLKRGGKPEEVANVIAWLASGQSSFMTGSLIDVAGGK